MSRLNTGSVYQIKTGKRAGKWAATVTMPDGKRRTRIASTATDAEQLRRSLLADMDTQAAPSGRAPTVADHVKTWLLYTIRPSVRPSTFEAYQHKAAMLMPLIGSKRLDKLEPADLRAAYARLATKGHPSPSPKRKVKQDENGKPIGLSSTSIKNAHNVIRMALEQAYRDGLVRRNIADLVTPPKQAEFDPQPFTRDEALAVLGAIKEHRHGPMWTVMLGTGIRIGEAAGLTWDNIDLAQRVVTITHTLTWPLDKPGQRHWERTPTKTKRSRRTLALPLFVVAALREQRARNAKAQLAAKIWQDNRFVFPDTHGGPVRANHVLVAWHRLLASLGLAPRRLHDLRASTATLLFADGAESRTVADQLGHSTTAMTHGHYIGSVPEMLKQAADRLDEILTPDEPDDDSAAAE
jgi:integrase